MQLTGIHHLTAVTADAPGNRRFYTDFLGMRLVKKSVNQDDPGTYHLFYADAEGHPIELFCGAVTYYPWLIREIAKSAWSVTKVILHPSLPISPTMTVVRASQKTKAGVATYANSITLTPGTITVGVSGNELTVHALVRDGALDVEQGGMDRRVSQFEAASCSS